MLIEHLNLIPCPICKETYTWNIDGITHDDRIIEGTVTCGNDHKWNVTQEILRLDKENSSESIVYSDREQTGFPKFVLEHERSDFLDFIEEYFISITFDKNELIISGDAILYYRYSKHETLKPMIVHENEGILRQLHEMAVQKRMHNNHSFIRSKDNVTNEETNQFVIFPKRRYTKPAKNALVLQFILKSEIPQGSIVWVGEKYQLEEISTLS
ncbi:MAG: hypothetical protein ACW99A_22655 [Candidatus Kariarchaeaceae archaeon]|jgi:hypothetical protein